VEIITAVAIISLLVVLSLPALKSMRETAKSAACIAQLRQLGAGCIAYAWDNKGALPQDVASDNEFSDKWHRQIYPYINVDGTPATWGKFPTIDKIYLCPADPAPLSGALSYGFNRYLTSKRILDLSKSMIILGDNKGTQLREATADLRHLKKINVCYADGHVETLSSLSDDLLKLP